MAVVFVYFNKYNSTNKYTSFSNSNFGKIQLPSVTDNDIKYERSQITKKDESRA